MCLSVCVWSLLSKKSHKIERKWLCQMWIKDCIYATAKSEWVYYTVHVCFSRFFAVWARSHVHSTSIIIISFLVYWFCYQNGKQLNWLNTKIGISNQKNNFIIGSSIAKHIYRYVFVGAGSNRDSAWVWDAILEPKVEFPHRNWSGTGWIVGSWLLCNGIGWCVLRMKWYDTIVSAKVAKCQFFFFQCPKPYAFAVLIRSVAFTVLSPSSIFITISKSGRERERERGCSGGEISEEEKNMTHIDKNECPENVNTKWYVKPSWIKLKWFGHLKNGPWNAQKERTR